MIVRPEACPPAYQFRRVFPHGAWPKLPYNRQSIAVHEAGHAVTAHALGLPVHGTRITDDAGGFAMSPSQRLEKVSEPDFALAREPDPAAYGLATLPDKPSPAMEGAALGLVAMLCAGRQAEIIAAGLPWPGTLWTMDVDGIEARACLVALYGSVIGLGWCQLRARSILTQHWPEVERIAGILVERGEWTPDSDFFTLADDR